MARMILWDAFDDLDWDHGPKSLEQRDAEEMRCKLLGYLYPLLHPLTILAEPNLIQRPLRKSIPWPPSSTKAKNSKWHNSAVLFASQRTVHFVITQSVGLHGLPCTIIAQPFPITFQFQLRAYSDAASFDLTTFRYCNTPILNTPFVRPIFSRLAKSAISTAFNMIDGLMGTRDRDTTSVFLLTRSS